MIPIIRAAALAAACAVLPVVALACPDYGRNGQALSYTSDQAWTPRAHSVIAGGHVDLSRCPMPGHGYVAVAPDFTMNFSANGMGRALEFRVEGDCDTVLLVNDATARWFFNDDDIGLDPRIRIGNAPEGIYDIWVGTFGASTCSARLIVETF
ncbi:MAG: peptidase S1 [Pararhodobacter sp.]|nr:peptidase S1 [Pararhodobacter sp.]